MAQEPLYTAEQIHIPPAFPDILKQFTKAAIKTQPDNIHLWAAEYFQALAKGEVPNVASRVPLQRTTKLDHSVHVPSDSPISSTAPGDDGLTITTLLAIRSKVYFFILPVYEGNLCFCLIVSCVFVCQIFHAAAIGYCDNQH